MPSTRNVIRIFLASPGDLTTERQLVFQEVEEFNTVWADTLGCQLELLGWEDTISGYGRPQELINPEVDRCDVFIGMLWKRWGSPPAGNGDYTSGFEEEFSRSLKRRQETGAPAVCLFFKEVPAEMREDPGDDLKRVLSFKQSIIEGRKVLYKEFSELSDLGRLTRSTLKYYAVEITNQSNKKLSVEQEAKQSGSSEVAQSDSEKSSDSPLTASGIDFLKEITDKFSTADEYSRVSAFEIARLRLLAISVSKDGNDHELIGVHDANILYRDRNGASFSGRELFSLLRVGVSTISYENTPLWCWYYESGERGRKGLILLSLAGNDDAVATGAIRTIARSGSDIAGATDISRDVILDSWLSEMSGAPTRNAALMYLGMHGCQDDIGRVNAEFDRNDYATARTALESLAALHWRWREGGSAERVILNSTISSISEGMLNRAIEGFDLLESEDLRRGLEHGNSRVRIACIEILHSRDELPIPALETHLNDLEPSVRRKALELMVESGKDVSFERAKEAIVKKERPRGLLSGLGIRGESQDGRDELENFELFQMLRLSEKELLERVDTNTPLDPAAYFALVQKYFSKYVRQLREDVDDQFDAYIETRIDRLRRRFVSMGGEDLAKKARQLKEHLQKQFTRKGLDILCKKGGREELLRLRRHVGSEFVRPSGADVELLKRFGEPGDLDLILDLGRTARASNTLLSDMAAENRSKDVAIAACKMYRERLQDLVARDLPAEILVQVIRELPQRVTRGLTWSERKQLFNNPDEAVRRQMAIETVRCNSKSEVENILQKYVDSPEHRFYNVIHWLDLGVAAPRRDVRAILDNLHLEFWGQ